MISTTSTSCKMQTLILCYFSSCIFHSLNKGQTISKAIHGFLNDQNSINWVKKIFRVVSFVRFLGELSTPEISFQIYWPLAKKREGRNEICRQPFNLLKSFSKSKFYQSMIQIFWIRIVCIPPNFKALKSQNRWLAQKCFVS